MAEINCKYQLLRYTRLYRLGVPRNIVESAFDLSRSLGIFSLSYLDYQSFKGAQSSMDEDPTLLRTSRLAIRI